MSYNLTALATTADCDALLDIANLEQDDLNFKKTGQQRQYRLATTGSTGIDAGLAGVNSQIAGLETAVATVPEGPAKQDLEDQLVDLRHKKYLLEKRRRSYGTLALVQKEHAIAAIDMQITESVSYIDAVTQRKAELARA